MKAKRLTSLNLPSIGKKAPLEVKTSESMIENMTFFRVQTCTTLEPKHAKDTGRLGSSSPTVKGFEESYLGNQKFVDNNDGAWYRQDHFVVARMAYLSWVKRFRG